MHKLKIYLDTSVISYLDASDALEKQTDTRNLWERIKHGSFDVYLSTVTLEEVFECSEPKLQFLKNCLAEIEYTLIDVNAEIREFANNIVTMGILNQKSIDDCLHIASAVVTECNCIISWNFKYLVNVKTINGVRAITSFNNYKSIDIVTPTMLLGDTDE